MSYLYNHYFSNLHREIINVLGFIPMFITRIITEYTNIRHNEWLTFISSMNYEMVKLLTERMVMYVILPTRKKWNEVCKTLQFMRIYNFPDFVSYPRYSAAVSIRMQIYAIAEILYERTLKDTSIPKSAILKPSPILSRMLYVLLLTIADTCMTTTCQ
jgi:hypothetical protein